MATQYETFGPCVPQVGTGTADALEALGVCLDGGSVSIQMFRREVKSDAGADAPTDLQAMGALAFVEFELPVKDTAVLNKVLRRSEGSATLGQGGVPGVLLGTGSHAFALYLPSSTAEPWYFAKAVLDTSGFTGKYGTEHTKQRLRFVCWRYIAGTASTTSSVALYTRAAP